MIGFFGVVYMGWLFQAWLPGYLEIQRHMSIPEEQASSRAIPFALWRRRQHRWRMDR